MILGLTIAMGILGIKNTGWSVSSDPNGHFIIRGIVFVLTFFVAVGGVFARSRSRRL